MAGGNYELLPMPEVDVFLIGAPKAGTTWLSYVLDQHDEHCLVFGVVEVVLDSIALATGEQSTLADG